ncbi:isochorismatase [Xylariaceae sp. FL0594]|nr:isochorismatase [Xylariaceae sp. FL0594]
MATDFKPALIVVDMQEDFCPPNGSLAVARGRDIAAPINQLLALPSFALKVATKDWHPPNHISFASNHAGKKAFVDCVEVANPYDDSQRYESRLWPVHCVQGTAGAQLIPELDSERLDVVIEKGTDARVEMYSPFYAPFDEKGDEEEEEKGKKRKRVGDSGLLSLLRSHAVTDVYVVGLAGDYCVKSCAQDSVREGFRTYLIEECTRAVDSDKASWDACKRQIEDAGAKIVGLHGPEVRRLGLLVD